MLTDYHCHVLPNMDDGAMDVDTSMQMLSLLKKQGVGRVVATPHFYAHKENSVEDFLQRREKARQQILMQKGDIPEVLLGAEIAIEQGISIIQDIEKLTMAGTSRILLEYPYSGYNNWMNEEVYNLSIQHKLQPIIAHVHRYLGVYKKEELRQIIQTENATLQINNEALIHFKTRCFVRKLIRENRSICFGSDSHDMKKRRPNFDLIEKFHYGMYAREWNIK